MQLTEAHRARDVKHSKHQKVYRTNLCVRNMLIGLTGAFTQVNRVQFISKKDIMFLSFLLTQ